MFLIKSVGIDLASVRSGLASLTLRKDVWEARLLDARPIAAPGGIAANNQFMSQLVVTDYICDYVLQHRPHIVGLETFTMQNASHVAFSMGQVGGMVRMRLWQLGVPVVNLAPGMIRTFAIPTGGKQLTSKEIKQKTAAWFVENLMLPGQSLEGSSKDIEDMVDAGIYALIGAVLYCRLNFKTGPPLAYNKYQAIIRRIAEADKYFIRNPEKEVEYLGQLR